MQWFASSPSQTVLTTFLLILFLISKSAYSIPISPVYSLSWHFQSFACFIPPNFSVVSWTVTLSCTFSLHICPSLFLFSPTILQNSFSNFLNRVNCVNPLHCYLSKQKALKPPNKRNKSQISARQKSSSISGEKWSCALCCLPFCLIDLALFVWLFLSYLVLVLSP